MYMKMLKLNGQLGIVGLPALRNMPSLTVSELIFQGHRNVFGSQIGGIKETQEMLDYSVEHNIYPEVEVIKARGEEIDKAYQNVLDGKVKFRYVGRYAHAYIHSLRNILGRARQSSRSALTKEAGLAARRPI
jgi:uncharacterized zinc-type alcohol dehydrogenase-like protein